MLIAFIYINIKRIFYIIAFFFKKTKLYFFIKNIKMSKRLIRYYYSRILRFSFIFILYPLPFSYGFYYIVLSHKFHFNHYMAIIIITIVSFLIHLTIGYTLVLMELLIQMKKKKIFRDYIDPIYRKNI